jgi:putative transposase
LKNAKGYSKKANPYDNAVVEAFFSNMKKEELNSNSFELFDELQESADKYIKFYNDYSPHNSLKGKTPNLVEKEFNGLSA